MGQSHNYAFFTSLPLTGADLTAGGNGWTACRIVGEISEVPSYRKSLEDEDEDGELVGEKHFDKQTVISLTLGVPAAFVFPEKNSVVVIDAAEAPGSRYNGNWQLDQVDPTWKAGDRAEVKIQLRKNEFLTLEA